MNDVSNVTPMSRPIHFRSVDVSVWRANFKALGAASTKVTAASIELNYLPAMADHARTLLNAANNCEKIRTDFALLQISIQDTTKKITAIQADSFESVAQAADLQEELAAILKNHATATHQLLQTQRQRLGDIAVAMPATIELIADLRVVLPNLDRQLVALDQAIEALMSAEQTLDDALTVMSQLKLTEIADAALEAAEKTVSLQGDKSPQVVLKAARELLKSSLGIVEESIRYHDLVSTLESQQAQLSQHRIHRTELAERLKGLQKRLEMLALVDDLEQQRKLYSQAFENLVVVLGQYHEGFSAPLPGDTAAVKRFVEHSARFIQHIRPIVQ